ncbi:MAG: nuclear transport factor 2 family protein [Pseudomonadota bacterium]
MFENEHPARRASLLSREYTQTHNREGWLSLWRDDAVIQDPIGVSHIDPEGEGHRGREAIENFYDSFIAPANISIEIKDSYIAANEVANHVLITVIIPTGEGNKAIQQLVHGVFAYAVDEQGKLYSMRGWWDVDDPINAMTEIELEGAASA